MRIVDLKTFLSLPSGTVYSGYSDLQVDSDLCVKESDPDDGWTEWDYVYSQLLTDIEPGEIDRYDYLFKVVEKGQPFRLDLHCSGRAGNYENNGEKFAIYDKEDVQMLVDRLQKILEPD